MMHIFKRFTSMTKLYTGIYVVDDDPSFGKSLKRLLNSRGIQADYFLSAQSFLDSVSPEQDGIAIVDIHMPECDGLSLMDKMRDMHYSMPVIVITGKAQSNSANIALQRGAVGFFEKPVNEQSLLDVFESQKKRRKV